jgi:hypothetical protein
MPISHIPNDTTSTPVTRAAGEVKPRVLTAWRQAVNIAKAPLASRFGFHTCSIRTVGNDEIGTDKIKNKQRRLVGEVTADHGNNTVIVTAFNPATGKPRHIIDSYTAMPTNESDSFTEAGGRIVSSGNIKATFEPGEQVKETISPAPKPVPSLLDRLKSMVFWRD